MSGDARYAQKGVPTNLLGLHRTSWTKDTLLVVLNHYGVSCDKSVTKLELMRRLDRLTHDPNLNRFGRLRILNAYTRGNALPPRQPKISTVTTVSAVEKTLDRKNVPSVKTASVEKISAFGCIVCLETLEITAFPKRKTTAACSHKPDVCLQCLSNSIATQFADKMWDQIDCPSCGQRLEFIDVKAFASSVVFER